MVWLALNLASSDTSRPLFDTKLSHFQNSADSPRCRWNIQWCLGFSSSPAWILRRPPGAPPARTVGPLGRVWTSSVGSGPLGAIYNPTPSSHGSARSPALLCQVLKERFLKMEQPYVPHPGALNELFIEEGVEFSPLTAQSTQKQDQTAADRSAILEDFSVAVCGVQGEVTCPL